MALVQHWKLDDNAANTTVVATVGNNGTLGGGDNTSVKQTSSGPGGSIAWAFDLNGTDDYVDISGATWSPAGPWTASLWVNLDGVTSNFVAGRVASSYRYLRILNSTTIVVATSYSDKSFTVPTMSTGTWYHVFIVKDASNNVHLYLNGTESSSGGLADYTGQWTLDAIGRRGTYYFNGRITQVRLWNSDESASVATWYAEGVTSGGGGKPWNYYAQAS